MRALAPAVVEAVAALRLVLHRDRLRVSPSRAGRVFVGFNVTPRSRRLRNVAVRWFLMRLGWVRRDFGRRLLNREDVHRRLMGWLGHAGQADSAALVARLSRGWEFRRGQFHTFRRPAVNSEYVRSWLVHLAD